MEGKRDKTASFRLSEELHLKVKQRCLEIEKQMQRATGRHIRVSESSYLESLVSDDVNKPLRRVV